MKREVKIVVGCPGSGKSTYLAKMAKSLDPSKTLILSYSRSAAATIAAKAGKEYKSSTIHSLCFNSLGIVSQQIMQGKQIEDFCGHIGINPPNTKYDKYEPTIHPYEIYNYARTAGEDIMASYFKFSDMAEFSLADYIFFVKSLLSYKESFGIYEFHDLLEQFNPVEAPENLLIDESQDNSFLLTSAIEKLVVVGVKKIWLVGDPNQAIYTYSGADPKWMYHFGGTEEFLEQSYRCPISVVDKAKSLLDARFTPCDREGETSIENSVPETANLILVRTNYIRYKLLKQTGLNPRAVMTIHKAKGMEADHVVLYNATTRRVRQSTELDPVAEKRVLFTAITRAKRKLTIVEGKVPNNWL